MEYILVSHLTKIRKFVFFLRNICRIKNRNLLCQLPIWFMNPDVGLPFVYKFSFSAIDAGNV